MRFSSIIWASLAVTLAGGVQVAFAADGQHGLVGRWELTSIDAPIVLRRREIVVIESTTIKLKRDCNEMTLSYSVQDNELSAHPFTTTAIACDPVDSFADEDQHVYEALLHARYEIKDNVLRLSSMGYRLEFHRVR